MTYIVLALKSEAQAFVDAFKLQKSKLSTFTTFSNSNIFLIISGVGVEHARMATQTLINHFDISDDDIFVNFGVCGGSKRFSIGEFVTISSVVYKEQTYILSQEGFTLTCKDEACEELGCYELVDMESYGFYDAVVHNPAIKKALILKVVSDHFEPHTLTKDMVKSLLFAKIGRLLTTLH